MANVHINRPKREYYILNREISGQMINPVNITQHTQQVNPQAPDNLSTHLEQKVFYGGNRSMDNRKLSLASRNYDVHTLDSKSMETVNSVETKSSNL